MMLAEHGGDVLRHEYPLHYGCTDPLVDHCQHDGLDQLQWCRHPCHLGTVHLLATFLKLMRTAPSCCQHVPETYANLLFFFFGSTRNTLLGACSSFLRDKLLHNTADFRASLNTAFQHPRILSQSNDVTNSFHSFIGLFMCLINWHGWETTIALCYCPVSLPKLSKGGIGEPCHVSNEDGNPPGIILMIKSKARANTYF